jgi:hypothetical protein
MNNSRKSKLTYPCISRSICAPWIVLLLLALPAAAGAEKQRSAIPFTQIGARATAGYQGDALGVTPTADGARLRCGFQRLEGQATPEGLWLESTKPGVAGRFRLIATAFSRLSTLDSQPSTRLPATGTVSVQDKLVRFTRPGLTEEYSVSVDGVQQDFVIARPPAGAGELRVELMLSGARAEATASGARLRLNGSARALAYGHLRVEDATGRELTARLEVLAADRLLVSVADANATYPVRIDPTFSDADWVGFNGMPGANSIVYAIAVDSTGNVYVGGAFTAIGTVAANHIAKWDGSTWSAMGSGITGDMDPSPARVNALAVNGTDLYVGGYFSNAGGVAANCIARWNGSGWSALSSGVSDGVYALAVGGTDLYAAGWFTTAGGVPANYTAKWDGSAWSALGSGLDGPVFALAVSGTDLCAGGEFSMAGGVAAANIAKWDGSAWSALGSGMNDTVNALAVSGADLFAGGVFTTAGEVTANYIAKWHGGVWSALGSGMSVVSYYGSPSVNALWVSGTNLYAGGRFTTAGGVPANFIAKWDGNVWSALGSGVNNEVYALAVSGTDLYTGGSFDTAGSVPANFIAKCDGNVWSALGSGMGVVSYYGSPSVNALAVSGTNLYAGGSFKTAGEVTAKCIAKWNSSAWSALGWGMDWCPGCQPRVIALAASGTSLYAGGLFDTAGGVPANNIAKWDGSTWSALGSWIPYSYVNALAVSGTDLYAGGQFDTAGGVLASSIAKWDGSAWSPLGSGVRNPEPPNGLGYGQVFALAVSGTNLYAGGRFSTAGGVPANHIAKWDGRAWSALGAGMSGGFSGDPCVSALAVSGTNLYAGGDFTSAGGVSATNIAKWDGSAWSALGSGMNSEVSALAVSGSNL